MATDEKRFYALVDMMRDTHDRKAKDYAPGEDRYKNFRQCESIGVPAYAGSVIRMGDKWSRITNLVDRELHQGDGPAVREESVTDTLMDLAIYALITIDLYEQYREAPLGNN